MLPAGTDTSHRTIEAGQPKTLRPDLHRTAFFDSQMYSAAHDVVAPRLRLQRGGDHCYVKAAVTLVLDDSDII